MRKKIRGISKSKVTIYKNSTIYAGNLSAPQAFELFDSADREYAKDIFESFIISFLGVLMMVQIAISSKPESAQWIDQLQSYKDLKQKIINGKHGLTVSACFGLSLAFPYAMDDLPQENLNNNLAILVDELVQSHTTNVKRIKPSKQEWLPYARGEMGAVKGQLLSCPSSNIKIMNINGSEVISYGLEEALKVIGFDNSTLAKYELDTTSIRNLVRGIFLTDKGGIPIEKLVYNEPTFVKSKIQDEILGDCLLRTEVIKYRLEKGVEPSPVINKAVLEKHLTKNELFAYNIAVRTGDVLLAKKLTNTAIVRSREAG